MFKYTPLYANGKEPVIEEQDLYRIEIPYIPTLQGSTFDTTQKSTQKSTQKILDLIRENPYVTTQEIICVLLHPMKSNAGWLPPTC